MKARSAILGFLLAGALNAIAPFAGASDMLAAASSGSDIQFSQSAPYATDAEISRRVGYREILPAYEVASQKFRLLVPEAYSTNSEWGLFVWISPSDEPRIPSEWKPELAKHRLLFVGAYDSGNSHLVVNRLRLALDATCNICRQFKIDRKRIYVAGFSGGARVASLIGVAYGDLFTGTLCVCGVDFYRALTGGPGQFYPSTYLPDFRVVSQAKKRGRFVLLTGENDFNRDNTKVILEKGLKPDGFSHVLYQEVPGMKHAIPGAADLNTALEFLDGTKG